MVRYFLLLLLRRSSPLTLEAGDDWRSSAGEGGRCGGRRGWMAVLSFQACTSQPVLH